MDAVEVDMIIGSLAGSLCAGGGFCAGSDEIVEHQRISAAAYTFSAALPAMLATTASETLAMLQTNPDIINQVRENIKTMWTQLDPRSEWVRCTSSVDNPIMLLVFKPEVVASKRLNIEDQTQVLQDIVDEVGPVCQKAVVRWRKLTVTTDTRQRGPDHPAQEHAASRVRTFEGGGVDVAAGAQSMPHQWPFAEGGGEGGHDDPACHHQDRQPAAVKHRLTVCIFHTSSLSAVCRRRR